MKTTIIGIELSEGISKKTGQPYSIGKLHATIPLQQRGAKGATGTTYDCEADVLKTVQHLECPFVADLQTDMVMKYGRQVQQITAIKPEQRGHAKA